MANIKRVRVTWQGGGVVGPSVNTFFFIDSATGFVADLATFYDAIKTRLPSIVSVTIPDNGDTLDAATGSLVGGWTDGTATTVNGTGTAQNPQGVGARVVWLTSGLSGGRRVRGSTFLVPLDASAYGTLGTLGAGASTISTAAATFVSATSGDFIVWTRPKNGAGGGTSTVTGSDLPLSISTLRSRRT